MDPGLRRGDDRMGRERILSQRRQVVGNLPSFFGQILRLATRGGFALRQVRGIVGSAGSPRSRARARRARRRPDWQRDTASPERARREVRSCALFATRREREALFKTGPSPLRVRFPPNARDRDRGLQGLLGRRGIGRVALQQDLGADTVHLRFVPVLLGAPPIRQAHRPGAGARYQSHRRSLRLWPGPLRKSTSAKPYLAPEGSRGRVASRRASTLRHRRATLPSLEKILRRRPKGLGDRIERRYQPTTGCRSRLLRGSHRKSASHAANRSTLPIVGAMRCRLGIGEGTFSKRRGLVDTTKHPQCEGVDNLC